MRLHGHFSFFYKSVALKTSNFHKIYITKHEYTGRKTADINTVSFLRLICRREHVAVLIELYIVEHEVTRELLFHHRPVYERGSTFGIVIIDLWLVKLMILELTEVSFGALFDQF